MKSKMPASARIGLFILALAAAPVTSAEFRPVNPGASGGPGGAARSLPALSALRAEIRGLRGPAAVFLNSWLAEARALPDGDRRQALQLIFKAASAGPEEARQLLASPLDADSSLAAGGLIQELWKLAAADPEAAKLLGAPVGAEALSRSEAFRQLQKSSPASKEGDAVAAGDGPQKAQAPALEKAQEGPKPEQVFNFNFDLRRNVLDLGGADGSHSFASALKRALKYKRKSQWQGPGWETFAYSLSTEAGARHASIFTTDSAEAVLEGLKLLQEEGYIQFLPRPENIHSIEPGKAGVSAAFEVAARDIDEMEAIALPDDAVKLVNPNGTQGKALHAYGLSYHAKADFDAMAKLLGKEIKDGRWKSVKVVLFFTDRGDAAYSGYTFKADASLRPLTADEYGEGFPNAEHRGAFSNPRYKPLPAAEVVRSPLASVDKAPLRMWVSREYSSSDERVRGVSDIVAVEEKALLDFAAGTDENDHIILSRYSISDMRIAKALVAAKEKGARVTLITDFNTSMDYEFSEKEVMVSDIKEAKWKDGAAGEFMVYLEKNGFKINSKASKWNIVSQPLYNKGDTRMDPIMHEKSLLLVKNFQVERDAKAGVEVWRGDRIVYYFGTANLTDHPRYNRVFMIDEPVTAEYALWHAQDVLDAFQKNLTIKDIVSDQPRRALFEDETFVETAYTNGRYNPNERILELLYQAAKDPGSVLVDEIVLSHFVLTNRDIVLAVKDLLRAQKLKNLPRTRLYGVFDDKFIGLGSYGLAGVLDGFLVIPEFGKATFPLGLREAEQTDFYGYQKPAFGPDGGPLPEKDLEGPPVARDVWHDKTTMIRWREKTPEGEKAWADLFTGSLNNSNHFDNAEMQVHLRLRGDSPWVGLIRESIEKVVAQEPEYALSLPRAILRNTLARLIGKSPLEIPLDAMDALSSAWHAKNLEGLGAQLLKLLAIETTLVRDVLPREAAEANVRRLMAFVRWYRDLPRPASLTDQLSFQKLSASALPLAFPRKSPWQMRTSLRFALWEPHIADDETELDRRVQEAWKVLEIEKPFPHRADPEEKQAPKKSEPSETPPEPPA